MVAVREAATGTLSSGGSGEADVGVTDLVEDAAVAVLIVASVRLAGGGLAERDGGLENRTLHVIDENGEVARLAVVVLAPVAIVWGWVLGWGVGVLAATTLDKIGRVESATGLEVSPVIGSVNRTSLELWPILDLHRVVLTVSEVRNRWRRGKVRVERV